MKAIILSAALVVSCAASAFDTDPMAQHQADIPHGAALAQMAAAPQAQADLGHHY